MGIDRADEAAAAWFADRRHTRGALDAHDLVSLCGVQPCIDHPVDSERTGVEADLHHRQPGLVFCGDREFARQWDGRGRRRPIKRPRGCLDLYLLAVEAQQEPCLVGSPRAKHAPRRLVERAAVGLQGHLHVDLKPVAEAHRALHVSHIAVHMRDGQPHRVRFAAGDDRARRFPRIVGLPVPGYWEIERSLGKGQHVARREPGPAVIERRQHRRCIRSRAGAIRLRGRDPKLHHRWVGRWQPVFIAGLAPGLLARAAQARQGRYQQHTHSRGRGGGPSAWRTGFHRQDSST